MAEDGIQLVVRVLGPFEAAVGGRPVTLTGRIRSLLAVLALSAGRSVSVERLGRALWDDEPPDHVRRSLQTNVTRLRAMLGTDAITFNGTGYRLRSDPDSVDALRFSRLVDEAGQDPDPEAERQRLTEALAMWRGTPFDGVGSGWLARVEEPRLTERYLAAVERRVDLDLAGGAHAELVAELSELTARHPLRESLWVRLLRALQQCGRRAEALARYETIRVRLVDELGTDPGPELRQVHADLLAGEPTARIGPAVAFQHVVPRQLPANISGFVGRQDALKALEALRAGTDQTAGTVVITAIAGTAGIGKTALAVHWAHRVADQFPDGQLYLNLRGYGPSGRMVDPARAVRGFLDAMGVSPQQIPRDPDAQVGLYRSLLAGKRMLILLDNARTPEQVRPLLPGSSRSMVLVTSRDQLAGLIATDAAHSLVLDLLSLDEARQLVMHRLGADRVAAAPAAADEIITSCARLPLALAIVAARVASQPNAPLPVMAAQLRDARSRLDMVTTGDPATDVRAVFSWSYHTLREEAAWLFRSLGLHPGPDLSVAAAASLAGIPVPHARRLLAELAQAHLVTEHLPGRYTFHDLLRAYAIDLTYTHDPDDVRHAARHRMLDHYLHTAYTAALQLDPHRLQITPVSRRPGVTLEDPAGHEQALRWFATEQAVLLAAVPDAASTGFDTHAWQLAWTLWDAFDWRAQWADWVAMQRIALDAAIRLDDPVALGHAHRGLGHAYVWLDRPADAYAHLHDALRVFERIGDVVAQVRVLLSLSAMLGRQERHLDALRSSERAIDLARAGADLRGEAMALNSAGWDHAQLGNYQQAFAHCRQALRRNQELGDRLGEANAWDSLGYAQYHAGQYEEAIACFLHALQIFRDRGSRYPETDTLTHLGDAHLAAGDEVAARNAWRSALGILEELDHPDAEAVRARLSGAGPG